jgi:hypothetical protein
LATAFCGTALVGCGGNTALLLSRACSVPGSARNAPKHHGFKRMRLRGLSVRATNSISPLSYKIRKPWPSEFFGHVTSQVLREPAALGKSFKARASARHHQLSHPAAAAALKSHFFDSIDPSLTLGTLTYGDAQTAHVKFFILAISSRSQSPKPRG